jgi:hypothetical protein
MDSNMARGILRKAQELNQKPSVCLKEVHEITQKLRSYLAGAENLTPQEINKLVEGLTVYTSLVPASIPLQSGVTFSRAVKYMEMDGINCYKDPSRLSYIPENIGISPQKGRINKAGRSLFYASVSADVNSLGAILSEVRACKGDIFNILQCRTKLENPTSPYDGVLNVAPVGISDYFRRDVPTPFQLHDTYKEIYELYRHNTHPTSLTAMQLCDAFLTDVLKAEESPRLYDVTSAIGEECLKADPLDGILYPSTKFEGFPNVALKPRAVDKKIRFETTLSVKVEECYGYGIFKVTILDRGIVDSGTIQWSAIA